MNPAQFFETWLRQLPAVAGAKLVYGDPIATHGKTILPVAQIRYGFGGGGGAHQDPANAEAGRQGGGGGGGLMARPVGVIEVTAEETHFIPIHSKRKLAAAFVLGLTLGYWLSSRKRC
jgi:uncharacterized spore protein YtfJ